MQDVEGEIHKIKLHPSWKGARLVARTLDLKSAYTQSAVAFDDLCIVVTCMFDPEANRPRF